MWLLKCRHGEWQKRPVLAFWQLWTPAIDLSHIYWITQYFRIPSYRCNLLAWFILSASGRFKSFLLQHYEVLWVRKDCCAISAVPPLIHCRALPFSNEWGKDPKNKSFITELQVTPTVYLFCTVYALRDLLKQWKIRSCSGKYVARSVKGFAIGTASNSGCFNAAICMLNTKTV